MRDSIAYLVTHLREMLSDYAGCNPDNDLLQTYFDMYAVIYQDCTASPINKDSEYTYYLVPTYTEVLSINDKTTGDVVDYDIDPAGNLQVYGDYGVLEMSIREHDLYAVLADTLEHFALSKNASGGYMSISSGRHKIAGGAESLNSMNKTIDSYRSRSKTGGANIVSYDYENYGGC